MSRRDLNKPVATGLESGEIRSQAAYDLERAQKAVTPTTPTRSKRRVDYNPDHSLYPRYFIERPFPNPNRRPKVNFRYSNEEVTRRTI